MIAAFAVLSGALLLAACPIGVNLSDEGIWASAGWLLDRGLQPWRTWFMPHPSVLAWVYDGLYDAFGRDLVVGRRFWALLRAAGLACAVAATGRLAGLRAALGVGLLGLLAGGPWHKAHVALGQGISLLGLLVCAGPPRSGFVSKAALAAALGLAQGLVASLDLGNNLWLLPPTALLLATAPRRGPRLAAWAAGLALGLAPLAAVYLPALDALRLEVGPQSWVAFDPSWVRRASWAGFPDLFARLAAGPRTPGALLDGALLDLAVVGPLLGVAVFGRRWWRTPTPERLAALAPSLLAAAALPKLLVRADVPHVLQAALPLWVVLAQLTARPVRAGPAVAGPSGAPARARPRLALAAALAVFGLLASAGWRHGYYAGSTLVLLQPSEPLGLPGASLRDHPARAAELRALVRQLRAQARPGDTLLALPTLPTLHALTDLPNSGRLLWLAPPPGGDFDTLDRAFAWQIESTAPTWVVLEEGPPVHGDGRPLRAQAPRTFSALDAGYGPPRALGRFTVRRAIQSPPPRR